MPKSSKPKSDGFTPIEVTVGETSPPLVREVDFSSASVEEPKAKSEPARPAAKKESD